MELWILYALLSMVFAGITSVIAKMGLQNVSGDAGLAVRTTAVFVLVWLNALALNHTPQLKQLTAKDVGILCLSGLTTTLSWVFYYRAMKLGEVSVVALIDKGSIVITLLLAVWWLGEALTWRTAVGGALILAGLLVMVLGK